MFFTKEQVEKEREYITNHKKNVLKWISSFSSKLFSRGVTHDDSKLASPEFEKWTEMDIEPRYPYGSKNYKDKKRRWSHVFDMHYASNRHHPEFFSLKEENDRDLLDILEMICDWLAYKDKVTYEEAITLVLEQCNRYKFSDELTQLIFNTIKNNFVISNPNINCL